MGMKRFVTTYKGPDGSAYGGYVDALDYEQAQSICDDRGLGEQVEGILVAVVKSDTFTREQADLMCQRFAEQGDVEYPEPHEFGDDFSADDWHKVVQDP